MDETLFREYVDNGSWWVSYLIFYVFDWYIHKKAVNPPIGFTAYIITLFVKLLIGQELNKNVYHLVMIRIIFT